MWLVLVAALLAVVSLQGVSAYVASGPGVMPHSHHRLKGLGPPLTGFTAASGAWGFRLLRGAYLGTGAAARLRRVSDALEADIGFVGNDFDSVSAAAHCAATSCFVVTLYDQSGNGRHVTNAAAGQPAYVGVCVGGKPCMRVTANTQALATASNFTPATGLVSLSVVGDRSAGVGACQFMAEDGLTSNRIAAGGANGWALAGSAGGIFTSGTTDGVWHAAAGVLSGAGSVLSIDGVEQTGSVTGYTAAGQTHVLFGQASTSCDAVEAIYWDNYGLSSGERSSLVANQRSYWGF